MLLSFVFGALVAATAAFEPASVFSDHAVLRRSAETPVFGLATPGTPVTVSLAGAQATTTTGANGKWLVRLNLASVKGDGPFELKMNGSVARDVLLGEVWLCSGQSNMSFGIGSADDYAQESKTTNRWVRCFFDAGGMYPKPQVRTPGHWICRIQTERGLWPAVGYHFAKALAEKLQRPIGIVNASVGAASLEAWADLETFARGANCAPARAAFDQAVRDAYGYPEYERRCQAARLDWAAKEGRADRPHAGPPPASAWRELSADDLYKFFRRGGAYWFRRTITLPQDGVKHRLDYARFVERIWNFNLAQVEVYWNGVRLTQRSSENVLEVHNKCFDVPPEKVQRENTLLVRAYDCDWTRQLPYAFLLDGRRLPETGWSVADEFELPPVSSAQAARMPPRQWHRLAQNFPGVLYNGKIAPIVPLGLSGVIWYQGESNARWPEAYRLLFSAFIEHWRERFQRPDLPFAWCQLAAYDAKVVDPNKPRAPRMDYADWPGLRAAQDAALALPHTGQAILLDAGEEQDIHPRDKRTPGRRLAAWALNQVYGFTDIPYLGPRARAAHAEGPVAVVRFGDATGGLAVHDLGSTYIVHSLTGKMGAVTRHSPNAQVEGFALAGADGIWHWADEATIAGDTVRVKSAAVAQPTRVRYGWAQNPWVNLYNGANLPACPFEIAVGK